MKKTTKTTTTAAAAKRVHVDLNVSIKMILNKRFSLELVFLLANSQCESAARFLCVCVCVLLHLSVIARKFHVNTMEK